MEFSLYLSGETETSWLSCMDVLAGQSQLSARRHGLPLLQFNRRRYRRSIAVGRVEALEASADDMEWRFFIEGVQGNTAQELSFLQWKKGQGM